MSLPLVPPRSRFAVDDVLPVEAIDEADEGWLSLRQHIGIEHQVGTPSHDGRHAAIIIPKAIALLQLDNPDSLGADRYRVVWSRGFLSDPEFTTLFLLDGFTFAVSSWHSVQVIPRSGGRELAHGWNRFRDAGTPSVGWVMRHDPWMVRENLTHVCIAVYGDR